MLSASVRPVALAVVLGLALTIHKFTHLGLTPILFTLHYPPHWQILLSAYAVIFLLTAVAVYFVSTLAAYVPTHPRSVVSSLRRAWRGQEPLGKTFWIIYMFFTVCLGMLVGMFCLHLLGNDPASSMLAYRIVTLISLPYLIFATVCVAMQLPLFRVARLDLDCRRLCVYCIACKRLIISKVACNGEVGGVQMFAFLECASILFMVWCCSKLYHLRTLL